MILIDTNVLVGLVSASDQLHARARRDGDSLGSAPLFVTTPVLTESCFYLASPFLRTRLFDLLEQLQIERHPREQEVSLKAMQSWLLKFAEHEPDYADAHLIQLSEMDRKVKIWTYDAEFRSIWRRTDGSRVPMAISQTR